MTKKRWLIALALMVVLVLSLCLAACKPTDPVEEETDEPQEEEVVGPPAETETLAFELNEDGDAYIITGIGTTDKDVTGIGIPAVHKNPDTNIDLPVEEIGDKAFNYEGNVLSEIYIYGENLKKIGNAAFYRNAAIKSINFPNSLKSIGDSAFFGCNALLVAELPNSLESIGKDAFWGCSKLNTIVIPEKITKIEEGTFAKCTALKHENTNKDGIVEGILVKAKALQSIGDEAFYGCDKLDDITPLMQSTVTSIGKKAFMSCSALNKPVTLPEGITVLEDETFSGCSKLPEIKLNEKLTKIGYRSFFKCSALTEMNIPKTVVTIGKEAFNEASNLSKITLNEGLQTIGERAFAKLSGNGVDDNDNPIFIGLNEIVIPNSVETIDKYAFADCWNLDKVTFGTGLKFIGEGAFRNSNKKDIPTVFNYKGTVEDWNKISIDTLNSSWGSKPGATITINCKDDKVVELEFNNGVLPPLIPTDPVDPDEGGDEGGEGNPDGGDTELEPGEGESELPGGGEGNEGEEGELPTEPGEGTGEGEPQV